MSVPPVTPIDSPDRPRWSVMIPAWNAEQFLAETLQSVLTSDLPDGSQIEVVDDCSEDGTRAVAERFATEGVVYSGHPEQQGAPANFNACLARARGRMVHLLHADDAVVPGFYSAADKAFEGSGAVAFVCRTQYMNESGEPTLATRTETATGLWSAAVDVLAVSNRVRPPGIAVRRNAYEAVGGYREDFPHAADWEMWMRLAQHGPVWFEDRILARYRVHDDQDTASKIRDASNITERIVALELINAELPEGSRHVRKGLLYTAAFASRTAFGLARKGDWSAAGAQLTAGLRSGLAGATGIRSLAP